MPSNYHKHITDNATLLVEKVKARVEYFIEDLWPALVELRPPAERMAWYKQIDWVALRDTSELIWAKLSADARRLMAAQEAQAGNNVNPIDAYEQQTFAQEHAYRAETQPYGVSPTMPDQEALGQNETLPLGRMA